MNVQTRAFTQTFCCFTLETGSGIYLFFPIQLIFFTAGLIISNIARVTFRRTIKITFIIDHHPPEPPPLLAHTGKIKWAADGIEISLRLLDECGTVHEI